MEEGSSMYGRAAYAQCRCGNWEVEHDPVTGHAPVTLVPNTEHRYEFYRFAFTKVSGEPFVTERPGQSEMTEADLLVNGSRQVDYGSPRANYAGIAKVWSGLLSSVLSRDITPEEAALMMVGLKLQREAHKSKRDNLVDAHGYLLVYAHIKADEEPTTQGDPPPGSPEDLEAHPWKARPER